MVFELCQRVNTTTSLSLSASVHSFVLESFVSALAESQIPFAISRALDCAASAAEEDILLPQHAPQDGLARRGVIPRHVPALFPPLIEAVTCSLTSP